MFGGRGVNRGGEGGKGVNILEWECWWGERDRKKKIGMCEVEGQK